MLGRNGIVTLALPPSDPAFPKFPNTLPAFPPGVKPEGLRLRVKDTAGNESTLELGSASSK